MGVRREDALDALIFPLFLLAILPGAIAVALLTKEYLVGLTDRRVLVLRVKGGKAEVVEVTEYGLDERVAVKAKTGKLSAHVIIEDEARPFQAKFGRMAAPQNFEHVAEIVSALEAPARRVVAA
ncbi:hypothetical protein [Rubrivirga sp.]|uniref:hypothetical protein n=1 Tax=Rubrivirga sp. TaxID=1885344 RepID=UPI003C719C59